MSNPCVVIEVSDHDQWAPFRGCRRIPDERRPTVLHPSREVAEQEAVRLARAHPERMFAVLEAAIVAANVTVPAYVTLGGQMYGEQRLPRLMQVGEGPDDIPF